jgi:hypothetical protein
MFSSAVNQLIDNLKEYPNKTAYPNFTIEDTETRYYEIISNLVVISDNKQDVEDILQDILIDYILMNRFDFAEILCSINTVNTEHQTMVFIDYLADNDLFEKYVDYLSLKKKHSQRLNIGIMKFALHHLEFLTEYVKQGLPITITLFNIIRENYNIEDGNYPYNQIYELALNHFKFPYHSEEQSNYCKSAGIDFQNLPPELVTTSINIKIPIFRILPSTFSYRYLMRAPELVYDIVDLTFSYNNHGLGISNTLDEPQNTFFCDSKWLQESCQYLEDLNIRNRFTVYGYTHNGDEFANKYIMSPQAFEEYVKERIYNYDEDADVYRSFHFFPLYYQTVDILTSLSPSEYSKYTKEENRLKQLIHSINYSKSESKTYDIIINYLNRNPLNMQFWKDVTKLYIKNLNDIINKSPVNTKTCIVYRGTKDKYYYPDKSKPQFKNNTFMSTSFSLISANEFAGRECCLKQIVLPPGSHGIFLEGLTQHPEENEILLPLDQTFEILSDIPKTYYTSDMPIRKNENDLTEQEIHFNRMCVIQNRSQNMTVLKRV